MNYSAITKIITLGILASTAFGCTGKVDSSVDSRSKFKTDSSQVSTKEPSFSTMLEEFKGARAEDPNKIKKPASFEKCLKRAKQSLKRDDFQAAIVYSNFAIEYKPDQALGYLLRGKARFKSNEFTNKKTKEDLEKTVSLDPNQPEAYDLLSKIYSTAGDTDRAIAAITRAIKLKPEEKDFYQTRASMYCAVHNDKLALADMASFIERNSKRVDGYVMRAKYLEGNGRLEEALADYCQAAKMTEEKKDFAYVEVLKQKADILSKLNRDEEAIITLTQAIATGAGDDDDAYRLRGIAYAREKKYNQAVKDFTSAIKISPSYAMASYRLRSEAYSKMGKNDLAKLDKLKADSLDKRRAEKPVYEMH